MRKRLLSLLLVCVMLAGILPCAVADSGTDPADVVILLDRSDNMNEEFRSQALHSSTYVRKMRPARSLAQSVIDAVLSGNDSSRVAIVAFDKEAAVARTFSKSRTLLKSTVTTILRSSEKANVEAALLAATDLLQTEGRSGVKQAVVLISAGKAQYYCDPTDTQTLGTGLFETDAAVDAALDQAHLMRDWGIDIVSAGIAVESGSHSEKLLCAAQNKGYFQQTASGAEICAALFAETGFDTVSAGSMWTAGFGKESIIPSDLPFLSYRPSDLPENALYDRSIFGEDLSFDPAALTGTLRTAMDAYLAIDTAYAAYPADARAALKTSWKSFLNRVLPLDPPFNPETVAACAATFDADYAAYAASVAEACAALESALGTDGEADAVAAFQEALPVWSLPQTRYWMAGYGNDKPCLGWIDQAYARAIYLDDNTGRGGVLLIAVESVGMSRSTVNEMRDSLAVFAHENNIREIHIMCDHNHAMVDTFGMWGKLLLDAKDPSHMEQVENAVKNAAIAAYESRTTGRLYAGSADARSQTEYGCPLPEDTRYPYVTENANILTRFRFAPDDASRREIWLLHLPVHVEALYGPNPAASADFLAPLADYLNTEANADFAFFTGAIGGLIRTTKEHEYPESFVPRNDRHKFWEITQVTGRRVGELAVSVDNEFELAPKLNFTSRTFETQIDNYLLGLVASLGIIDTRVYQKDVSTGIRSTARGFADPAQFAAALADMRAAYNRYKDSGLSEGELIGYTLASFAQSYFRMTQQNLPLCSTTEMSWIEFYQKDGTRKKSIVLTPGEMFPELVYGGLLTEITGSIETDPHNPDAENPETFVEIAARYGKTFGENNEDLIVFGLSNDMTGYVVPPNDFLLHPTLPYINGNKVCQGRSHYEETNSVGPNMAYVMAGNFEALLASIQ